MDIHEKGLGPPATQLLDGGCVNAIQVHGHSPSCTEGVTADVILGVAKFVEPNDGSSIFQGCIDVCGRDVLPGDVGLVPVRVDVSGCGSTIGDNVMDPSSQGFDGTVLCSSAFL